VDDVVPLLAAADVLLLPSETESFGLVALEAMASGVPVVATDVGGLPEVVEHGVTGFLAPVGDVDAMARYCLQLLSDRGREGTYAANARKRAAEKFDFRTIIPKYEKIYERLLAGAPTLNGAPAVVRSLS
jgi:glycosyltransferase involved in cell wall biosynthesis